MQSSAVVSQAAGFSPSRRVRSSSRPFSSALSSCRVASWRSRSALSARQRMPYFHSRATRGEKQQHKSESRVKLHPAPSRFSSGSMNPVPAAPAQHRYRLFCRAKKNSRRVRQFWPERTACGESPGPLTAAVAEADWLGYRSTSSVEVQLKMVVTETPTAGAQRCQSSEKREAKRRREDEGLGDDGETH